MKVKSLSLCLCFFLLFCNAVFAASIQSLTYVDDGGGAQPAVDVIDFTAAGPTDWKAWHWPEENDWALEQKAGGTAIGDLVTDIGWTPSLYNYWCDTLGGNCPATEPWPQQSHFLGTWDDGEEGAVVEPVLVGLVINGDLSSAQFSVDVGSSAGTLTVWVGRYTTHGKFTVDLTGAASASHTFSSAPVGDNYGWFVIDYDAADTPEAQLTVTWEVNPIASFPDVKIYGAALDATYNAPGDLDGNGYVSRGDLDILFSYKGQDVANCVSCDLNEDGAIDTQDVRQLITDNPFLGRVSGGEGTILGADRNHTVGLQPDGTVIATGNNDYGQLNVGGWTGIVAVTTGGYNTVGLKADGTVVGTGINFTSGDADVSGWTNIIALAAGHYHVVGLKADGTVVATGANNEGQSNVGGWTDIVAVAGGYLHTVGVKADGTVVAVGYNNYGQTNVAGWADIVAVAGGELHTVGLRSDGTVVGVGKNHVGQTNVAGWTDIVAVAANLENTVGLKSDGTVVGTGYNRYGHLGFGDWTDIIAVALSYSHTVGLKSDGTVVAVGHNGYGQLNVGEWLLKLDRDGDGFEDAADNCPGDVNLAQADGDGDGVGDICDICEGGDDAVDTDTDGVPDFCDVCPGSDDTLDVDDDGVPDDCDNCSDTGNADQTDSDGDLLGDFCDNCYQVSNEDQADFDGDGTGDVCDVAGDLDGNDYTSRADFDILFSYKGQDVANCIPCDLNADGAIDTLDVKQLIRDNPSLSLVSRGESPLISAGDRHTVGLKSDGTVVATNYNVDGQADVYGWTDIIALAAGSFHTSGLRADGTVVAVGDNTYGQLEVDAWKDIVAIAAGERQTLGLKADGTVLVTSYDAHGMASSIEDWTDIVAADGGLVHAVGLKSDGTVVAAGYPEYYAGVETWTDIVAVATGRYITVGLKSDGTVVGTGSPGYYAGIETWTGIVAVSVGIYHHIIGLKSDGTVVAAGVPAYFPGVENWTDIIAVSASYTTIGLKENGTVVASAGSNEYGQLNVGDWNLKIDRDGDGFEDADDNCPQDANLDQSDFDGDGTGDVCDVVGDLDGNDYVSKSDISVLTSYVGKDADYCATCDLNGDGVIDVSDLRQLLVENPVLTRDRQSRRSMRRTSRRGRR